MRDRRPCSSQTGQGNPIFGHEASFSVEMVVAAELFAIMAALFTVTLPCRFVALLAVLLLSASCRRSPATSVSATAVDAGSAKPDAAASVPSATASKPTASKPTEATKAKTPEPLHRCFPDDSALSPPRSLQALLDRAADKLEQANDQPRVCTGKESKPDPQQLLRDALACTEEALRQDERSVEAHHNRGLALIGLDRKDEAQRAFTHALALDPDDPETLAAAAELYIHHLLPSTEHTQIGLAYVRHGKAVLKRATEPTKRRAAMAVASTAPKRTQTSGTQGSKGTRPDRTPRPSVDRQRSLLGRLLLLEGQALSDLGRASQALAVLEEAITLTDSDQARYERGLVLFDLCRLKEAQTTFAELTKRSPDDAWSHHQLGLVVEMLGDVAQAEKEFAAARKLAPMDFPMPLPVSANQFRLLVAQEVAALSQTDRDDLQKVRLELADLPSIDDLTADQPTLSPTIVGLYRGLPAGVPDSEPRSIVLYRKNLLRIVASHDELRTQVRTTLLHELGHFRGEDDDELRDRGLE